MKHRSLTEAGGGSSFVDPNHLDVRLTFVTPVVNRVARATDNQEALCFDSDRRFLLHARTIGLVVSQASGIEGAPLLCSVLRFACAATVEVNQVLVSGQHTVVHSDQIIESYDRVDG